MIVLHEWFRNSEVRKRALVVAFQKEATVVAEHARFEEQKAGEAGGDCFHPRVFINKFSSIRTRVPAAIAADRRRIHCCASAGPALPVARRGCTRSDRRLPPGKRPSGPGVSPASE